jgi:hypothetical protein
MTPQQVIRVFDILLDKTDSPYYLPSEKYDLLTQAQMTILDKYFYNKSAIPNDLSTPIGSYENTEYNAQALANILYTTRMQVDQSGHITFGVINNQLNYLSNIPDAQVYQIANTATVASTALTGTLTVAANGAVTGTGTAFISQLGVGSVIFTQDKNWTIKSVTSDTIAEVVDVGIVQTATLPMRVIAANAARTVVRFVRQNDILAFQQNVFKRPSTTNPLRCIDGEGYLFYPQPTSEATRMTVEMNVLRMPQDFNAMNNIGFELAPFTHNEIILEALKLAGASIRDGEFQQAIQQIAQS